MVHSFAELVVLMRFGRPSSSDSFRSLTAAFSQGAKAAEVVRTALAGREPIAPSFQGTLLIIAADTLLWDLADTSSLLYPDSARSLGLAASGERSSGCTLI